METSKQPWTPPIQQHVPPFSSTKRAPTMQVPLTPPPKKNAPKRPSLMPPTSYHLFYITWVWLLVITIIAFWAFFTRSSSSTPSVTPAIPNKREEQQEEQFNSSAMKAYPFNVYDNTLGRVVRYPAEMPGISKNTPGIHGLVWDRVTWFRVCCKNAETFQCFPTEEVSLQHDVKRAKKGYPDNVYLEIAHKSEHIGTVGARCTLYWMDQKIVVEQ